MDPNDRHELKENDLQEFFIHFSEWWNKWGSTVLLIVVVVLAGFVGYNWWTNRINSAREAAWSGLAAARTPQQLQTVAAKHDNQAVGALARLRAADLYLEQAVKGPPPQPEPDRPESPNRPGDQPPRNGSPSPQSQQPQQPPTLPPEQALKQARALYKQVLANAPAPLYRANALLGLASVAENRRQWKQAAEAYHRAIQLARTQHLSAIAAQATRRRAMLRQLQSPVVFVPETETGPENGPAGTGPGQTKSTSHEPPPSGKNGQAAGEGPLSTPAPSGSAPEP